MKIQERMPRRHVRMPDGARWLVVRQHEMTQLMTRAAQRERRLFLFFHGEAGALRRATVPPDFPEAPTDDELRREWERAEILH